MKDPRVTTLAKNLINNSLKVQKGEKVLIEAIGECGDLLKELIAQCYAAEAMPFVWIDNNETKRALLMSITEELATAMADIDGETMKKMDCYIGVRGSDNVAELSDVPAEKTEIYNKYYSNCVHSQIRLAKRWVVLRYPSPAFAQMAKMSTEAFEDFYFDVCNIDYSKMGQAMQPLVELMNRTDKVRIVGPNDTDISFSIKDIPAIPCDGFCNIPDGEVYTAPVKNSVNGVFHYNTPSPKDGFTHEDVRLVFKDGKIVEATGNDSERLEKVFNVDEGARYVGEFAIGVNPNISQPMGDILFDEKINGSIHFTPGNAYDDADNGNRSALHWDMVLIQRSDYGGGEIYFDDILIRKDGRFVVKELEVLNPENLR